MARPSHSDWVRWGDVAESVKDWVVAVVFVAMAALSGSVLGVTALLGILDMIGTK